MEALRTGATRYNSERRCTKHGKVERYTKNRGCVICTRESKSVSYHLTTNGFITKPFTLHKTDLAVVTEFIKQLNDAKRGIK